MSREVPFLESGGVTSRGGVTSCDTDIGGWNLGAFDGDTGEVCRLSKVCVEYSVMKTFLS